MIVLYVLLIVLAVSVTAGTIFPETFGFGLLSLRRRKR